MLKIRLRRTGKRNQPHYRLVVAEHTAPITGKFVAVVGHYNPRSKELVVNAEEITKWLNQGAQASNTVARLLSRQGIEHKQLQIHSYKERPSKKAAAEGGDETAPVAEAPAAEAPSSEPAPETPASEETPASDTDASADDAAKE